MDNLLFAAFYFGITIYLANQETLIGEVNIFVRPLLYGLLFILVGLGLSVLMTAFLPPDVLEQLEQPVVTPLYAALISLTAILTAIIGWRIIVDKRARLFIKNIAGQNSYYNPDHTVHMVASVIAVVLIGYLMMNFLAIGGQEGLAQVLMENPITLNDVIFQDFIYVLIALLGVGAFIRRTGNATLARLGLRYPTRDDWVWGGLGGLGLFGVYLILVSVIVVLIPPEILQSQTAATDQIAQTASESIGLTVALSILPAISEEILYRGALQPVFGLWLTSVFFAISHVQYIFTPATLVILIIAIGLGWIRQRTSTTGAIIAHFFYNAILLILAYLGQISGV